MSAIDPALTDRILAASDLTRADIQPTIEARVIARLGGRTGIARRRFATIVRDETRRFYDRVAAAYLARIQLNN